MERNRRHLPGKLCNDEIKQNEIMNRSKQKRDMTVQIIEIILRNNGNLGEEVDRGFHKSVQKTK